MERAGKPMATHPSGVDQASYSEAMHCLRRFDSFRSVDRIGQECKRDRNVFGTVSSDRKEKPPTEQKICRVNRIGLFRD